MKKWISIVLCLLLLTGCSSVQTFETLGAIDHQTPQVQKRSVMLRLPEDASRLVSGTEEEGGMYFCREYTFLLQTYPSGDLAATVETISGFQPGQVTLLESTCGDHRRYDWVWTAAGENGDVVCRGTILDDGIHHYCLSAMADATDSGTLTGEWNDLFGSFCLE